MSGRGQDPAQGGEGEDAIELQGRRADEADSERRRPRRGGEGRSAADEGHRTGRCVEHEGAVGDRAPIGLQELELDRAGGQLRGSEA